MTPRLLDDPRPGLLLVGVGEGWVGVEPGGDELVVTEGNWIPVHSRDCGAGDDEVRAVSRAGGDERPVQRAQEPVRRRVGAAAPKLMG